MIFVIVLGTLLVAGAGAVCGLLIADNLSAAAVYTPHLLGHALPSLNATGLFCAGLALGLLFCIGIWFIAAAVIDKRRDPRWDEPAEDFLPGQWRTP
jgi:hypothetical protein